MGARGGDPPKTHKNQVFKGFGGIQGIQGHGGNHRSGFPEYGPMPWSGDPIQARFPVFRTRKSVPGGSGRLRAAPGRLLNQKIKTALAKIKDFGVNLDFS